MALVKKIKNQGIPHPRIHLDHIKEKSGGKKKGVGLYIVVHLSLHQLQSYTSELRNPSSGPESSDDAVQLIPGQTGRGFQ